MFGDAVTGGQGSGRVIGTGRFGPEHADPALCPRSRQCGACQQTTAADRRDDDVEAGDLFDQLQCAAALSGNDAVVVIGRDRFEALFHPFPQPGLAGLLSRCAEVDRAAVTANGLDLEPNGTVRHHDMGRETSLVSGSGQCRTVIAGGVCCHAMAAVVDQADGMAGAAEIARSGHLQLLALEEDLAAKLVVK